MKNFQEVFEEMRGTLLLKQEWQKKRREIYEGKNEAETLNIALPKPFDQKLKTHLGWGKTAVDTLLQDTVFDGFKNDSLGFTRLLYQYKGYGVIESCQRNSMIGACSFATVLPRQDGTPIFTAYSGAEATGFYDSSQGFIAGLVTNSFDRAPGIHFVKDYLLFTRGTVYKVDPQGKILASYKMPTERLLFVPFIYEQDLALSPFGASRINYPFINALESALRTLKLIEVGHDVRVAIRNVLLANQTNPSDLKKSEQNVDLTQLLTIFNEGAGTVQLEQLAGPSTAELQQMLGLLAANAATAVNMDSTSFGFQPSNGAFSEGTLEKIGRPYQSLVRRSREGFGESIKELALTAMSLSTGQYDESWNYVQPAYLNSFSMDRFGAIADGIGKLQTVAPDVDFSSYIEEYILSKSVKEEALKVELPSFEVARKQAEKFKIFTDQMAV